MKILVVDDEALLVKGIKFNLENEGYSSQTGSDNQLHGRDPPTFGFEKVDDGTPQGLDNPWQIEPTGV